MRFKSFVVPAITEIKYDLKELRKEVTQLSNLIRLMQTSNEISTVSCAMSVAAIEAFSLPIDSEESLLVVEEKVKSSTEDRKCLVR